MDAWLLALAIVAFGVALIYIAKLSRLKSEKLREEGIVDYRAVVSTPLTDKRWFTIHAFGPQPKIVERIGRFLAAAITITVTLFIVGIILAVIYVRL